MQKIALTKIIREEAIRAITFASILFTLLFAGFAGIAYAADGGAFGAILNQILASGDWQSPGDGTVNNSANLGGLPPSSFVQATMGITCDPGKCITAIDGAGIPTCN